MVADTDAGAHPRSRGENLIRSSGDMSAQGSSPLTRGKLGSGRRGRQNRGLIPAHAGKTEYMHATYPDAQAHPRSRGENRLACGPWTIRSGSSPLTRGKLDAAPDAGDDLRLIPAHAGKTTRPASIDGWSMGSSPLTRGKLEREPGPPEGRGLIPAHAGKT